MIAGVGLFGTLSGFLANTFLSPRKKKEPAATPAEGVSDPKARLAEIRRMLETQEQATADLKAKLDEIDRLI
jgi:hypothetical protein